MKEIVIAGCGLSGMLTALCFAQHQIPVLLIEQKDIEQPNFCYDPRTTAITDYTKQFLSKINIWDAIANIAGPINDIYVVDNKAPTMLHFAGNIITRKMGYLVENNKLKQLLLALVKAHRLIQIVNNTSYHVIENNHKQCLLAVGDRKISTDLLIICDSKTLIKERYFSNETEKSYGQYALTFLIRHEKQHAGTAMEHFTPNGPFATLPLQDEHLSSIVWSVSNQVHKILTDLPKEDFLYLVEENLGKFLGEISLESEISAFALKASIVKNYFNKKIVLLADSAHIIHPLAGQGLNQGIKDIEALVLNITKHQLIDTALANYQAQRQEDNRIMFELTDALNRIFLSQSQITQAVRKIGFKLIKQIPTVKKLLIQYAIGRR